MTTSIDAINPRPLHNEVVDRLRELITRGELAPGARLNERVLTERFGISRTPLREAMKVLSAEGLIKLMPNRGALVTTITRADVEDLCQVMGALEALGGDLACQRASDEDIAEIVDMNRRMRAFHAAEDLANYFELNQQIHQKIIDSAGNRALSDSYRRISARVRRARYMANFSRARWNQAMAEHELITDALMKRDSDRLKSLLSMHLANKSKVVQDWLAETDTLQQKATA